MSSLPADVSALTATSQALHFTPDFHRKMEKSANPLATLLGGRAVLGRAADNETFDPMVWSAVADKGLPFHAISSFQKLCFPNAAEMFYALIGMSLRTAQRKATDRKIVLAADESANAVALASVIMRSLKVFGSTDNAERWWGEPNQSLGGVKPIALAKHQLGIRAIEDTLTAIEHGFFA